MPHRDRRSLSGIRIVAAVIVALNLLSDWCGTAVAASVVNLRCYSNMTFVPDTGDFVGLTMLLLLNDRGTSVVVQKGLGGLEPAFVAETTSAHDGSFNIEFPTSSLEAGLWKAPDYG